jgi:hypothetical protein
LAAVSSSKTYAAGANCAPDKARNSRYAATAHDAQEHSMLDVLMLALAFGLFALAIGYTYACERL